jgi:hypothetical protein
MTITIKKLGCETYETDGRQWYVLNGEDNTTEFPFENEEFGHCTYCDGELCDDILDGDGRPLTKGDREERDVRNCLKKNMDCYNKALYDYEMELAEIAEKEELLEKLADADGDEWSKLLRTEPSLAEHCDWSKLDGWDWSYLLRYQPQFADKCEWEKLDGYSWSDLLINQPQFAEHCAWSKLDSEDWKYLLKEQPQFEDKKREFFKTGVKS